METNITVLNQLPFSKQEQADFVQRVTEDILEGNINPIHVDLRLKALEEIIKKIRSNDKIKSLTIDEASKYEKEFTLYGVKITLTSRTTKDYSGCDTVLDDLYAQAEKLKEQIKGREATVSAGVDPVTGEVYKPPKTSTSNFLQYKF